MQVFWNVRVIVAEERCHLLAVKSRRYYYCDWFLFGFLFFSFFFVDLYFKHKKNRNVQVETKKEKLNQTRVK